MVADVTEDELRKIAADRKESPARRGAAVRVIRYMERGDLADFQRFLDGTSDLKHLRDNGIYTDIVKKVKSKKRTIPGPEGSPPTIELEREIELHDRSGEDFDRICDHTDGKATQRVEVTGPPNINLTINIPGLRFLPPSMIGASVAPQSQ
jgi:hypothetical protein